MSLCLLDEMYKFALIQVGWTYYLTWISNVNFCSKRKKIESLTEGEESIKKKSQIQAQVCHFGVTTDHPNFAKSRASTNDPTIWQEAIRVEALNTAMMMSWGLTWDYLRWTHAGIFIQGVQNISTIYNLRSISSLI